MAATILQTAYFPPISYFSLLSRGDVFLEAHENYQKQSWRNRCNILTSNGIELLNVPVEHLHGNRAGERIPITDIRIDWSRDWLTRHKRALDSAYMSSAFFEHYRDTLYGVLDRRPERLWDLNLSIINWLSDIWQLPSVGLTIDFGKVDGTPSDAAICPDIHPKHRDNCYILHPYWQVFSEKFPFTPNLSAIDLLFNEGPSGKALL